MNFDLGDIVLIDAPVAGHKKYHIYLGANDSGACVFLFMNSSSGYAGDITFDCTRFPQLPRSPTGQSVVSFSMLPCYNENQLTLFKAKKICELPRDIAGELHTFCLTVKTLTRLDRQFVLERLQAYISP